MILEPASAVPVPSLMPARSFSDLIGLRLRLITTAGNTSNTVMTTFGATLRIAGGELDHGAGVGQAELVRAGGDTGHGLARTRGPVADDVEAEVAENAVFGGEEHRGVAAVDAELQAHLDRVGGLRPANAGHGDQTAAAPAPDLSRARRVM